MRQAGSENNYDIIVCDQQSACIPILKRSGAKVGTKLYSWCEMIAELSELLLKKDCILLSLSGSTTIAEDINCQITVPRAVRLV